MRPVIIEEDKDYRTCAFSNGDGVGDGRYLDHTFANEMFAVEERLSIDTLPAHYWHRSITEKGNGITAKHYSHIPGMFICDYSRQW